MKKDIVIKGGYGLGNFGDDALIIWLVDYFKKEEINLNIYLDCHKSDYIYKEIDFSGFKRLGAARNNLLGGGTLFYEFDNKNNSLVKKIIKGFSSPKTVYRWLLARQGSNKKNEEQSLLMFGVGFGPFEKGNTNKFQQALSIARKSDFITIRDTLSYKLLEQHGVTAVLTPDICYLPNNRLTRVVKKATKNKKVLIVLRWWSSKSYMESLLSKILETERMLNVEGFEFVYCVFSEHADEQLIKLLEKSGKSVVVWQPEKMTVTEFLEFMDQHSFIISSRFHALVFATLLHKSSVSIEIEQKLSIADENSVCEFWSPSESEDNLFNNILKLYDNYDANVLSCQSFCRESRSKVISSLDEIIKRLV